MGVVTPIYYIICFAYVRCPFGRVSVYYIIDSQFSMANQLLPYICLSFGAQYNCHLFLLVSIGTSLLYRKFHF